MDKKESNSPIFDSKVLDELLHGRQNPTIYAFTVPEIKEGRAWKIGDTSRPVPMRLDEWKNVYSNLREVYEARTEAILTNPEGKEYFYRDYDVHRHLEDDGKARLTRDDFEKAGSHFSNEFFDDMDLRSLKKAIDEIKSDFEKGHEELFHPLSFDWESSGRISKIEPVDFALRDNQRAVVDSFRRAVESGHRKLLLYAVMRFGKSFTSLMAAKEMGYRLVVVVSAKADVKDEWKQTVEGNKTLNDYFAFADKARIGNLAGRVNSPVKSILENRPNGKEGLVLFFTLQDLMGSYKAGTKRWHEELVTGRLPVDLLIVDETHFGAWAKELGKSITETSSKDSLESIDSILEGGKFPINAKVRLHLSGTPYRLIMSGRFKEDEIICHYSYGDLLSDKEKWTRIGDNINAEEWENPYFGFPKMIRFAFSIEERLKEASEKEAPLSLNQLFESKDGQGFIYQDEVISILKAIDGSDNSEALGVFPFLDYPSIAEGKMCRHIVMVLPYKKSCDAMASILNDKSMGWKRLGDYDVVNISGEKSPFRRDVSFQVKSFISNNEEKSGKTISLTVNKMLTGSTVREWDTMIYFRDSSSPQEYDQSTFRIQNPFVVSIKDENGNLIGKIDRKPETLLVDFSPARLFRLEEMRARIESYVASQGRTVGNEAVAVSIKVNLERSPVIVFDSHSLKRIDERDVMKEVSKYDNNRGIDDEVKDIIVDESFFKNKAILNLLKNEVAIDSKKGLSLLANNGEEDLGGVRNDSERAEGSETDEEKKQPSEKDIIKKIQNYYRRILIYAFISDRSDLRSLDDVVVALSDRKELAKAKSVGLTLPSIKTLKKAFTGFYAKPSLDYKIMDINGLSNSDLPPIEKVKIAFDKFGKLGEAIVITPEKVTDAMVDAIGEEAIRDIMSRKEPSFLDIASVAGEFAYALSKRLEAMGYSKERYENAIYSLPKDRCCYELTKKVYSWLGLNTDCIVQADDYSFLSGNKRAAKQLSNKEFEKVLSKTWEKVHSKTCK